jgi:hypothetical protein
MKGKRHAAGPGPREITFVTKRTRRGSTIQVVAPEPTLVPPSNQSKSSSATIPVLLPTVTCDKDWSMDDQDPVQGNPRKTRGQVKQIFSCSCVSLSDCWKTDWK